MLAALVGLAVIGATVEKDLAYVPGGGERQTLDLYLPAGAQKAPVVVYIHGGAFMFGDKNGPFAPKWVVDQGYALAALNYRRSGEALFPAAVQDCLTAVRWLRANAAKYRLDPDRFVAWGESAGANLASMVGTAADHPPFIVNGNEKVSGRVQGVVNYYGPTDFLKMDAQALPGSQKHDPAESPESRYLGFPIQQHPEKTKLANPITFVSRSTPPFYIAHGEMDRTVPVGQSDLLVEALKANGVAYTYFRVPNADHVFRGISPADRKRLDDETRAFLKRTLGG